MKKMAFMLGAVVFCSFVMADYKSDRAAGDEAYRKGNNTAALSYYDKSLAEKYDAKLSVFTEKLRKKTAKKPKIFLDHNVELPKGRSGFRFTISGWLVADKIVVYAVGPEGQTVAVVPESNALEIPAQGDMVLDVDYGLKGLKKGSWIFVIAGKGGIEKVQVNIP